MTDVRANDPNRGEYDRDEIERERELDADDRLPWLEAAEEEEAGPSPLKLIGALLIGLLVIGVIVGGLFWLGNRGGNSNGNGEIIPAPDGPYKTRSDDPGSMQVDNRGTSQIATSEGAETNASIDRGATTEAPVTGGPAADTPAAPKANEPARPAAPAPAQPARSDTARPAQGGNQPRLTGQLIQIGSYPSEAIATGEWARISGRYPYLRGLQHAVVTYQAGNRTFYRLRAGGEGARAVCGRLQAAHQPCYDVPEGQ